MFMLIFARLLAARKAERLLHGAAPKSVEVADGTRIQTDDVASVVPTLVKNGVCTDFRLLPEDVRQILDFAENTVCYPRDGSGKGFLPREFEHANTERQRDVIAAYYFDRVKDCAAIERLQVDPLICGVANAYLGEDVQNIRTRLWWSFPAKRVDDADLHAAAQEKFHFDMNDWRTLKFFFYITPTDEQSGAHRYIEASHRKRRLRHQFTLMVGHEFEELLAYYGPDAIKTVTGDAGAGFAEDPFTFHTGTLCRTKPRLILELEYGPSAPSPSYRYGVLG
ncbi:hypothetical protein [Labrys monachus]|uniref:Uncharacterized protein n=1 Tax=Labrys monachus TaxID=217067 RepID=A0ABU0F863_9HYPH|nr:hypothetical protein [Labrys monachus]MDQ0390807.1 hypothetical protein [Labrys monachus]